MTEKCFDPQGKESNTEEKLPVDVLEKRRKNALMIIEN